MPTKDFLSLKRILFVEDDKETCDLISLVFAGYDFAFSHTLKSALPRVRNEHFDVYVLDAWLPDGSGTDLCREIRRLKPDSPIIFTSGAAMRNSVDEAIDAGATRYIIKPYDPFDLLEIVKQLIDAAER